MPKVIYWKASLCILACIKGLREYGVIYQRGTVGSISLEVFADADYVSKATDKPSMSGGAVMCGDACVFFCPGLRVRWFWGHYNGVIL